MDHKQITTMPSASSSPYNAYSRYMYCTGRSCIYAEPEFARAAYIFTNPDDSAGNVVGTGSAPTQLPGGRVARSPKSRFGDTTIMIDQIDLFGDLATGSINHRFAGGLELSYEKATRGSYSIVSTPEPSSGIQNVMYKASSNLCTFMSLTPAHCVGFQIKSPLWS